MSSILTAIYDKKARTFGRIIQQKNVEEAIRSMKDALNSKSAAGEWLMPSHREHPEDYCLVMFGYFNESALDTIDFDDKGKLKEKQTTDPIKLENRILIELKDIELKETKETVNWHSINENMGKAFSDFGQILKQNADMLKEIAEKIKEKPAKKRGFWH